MSADLSSCGRRRFLCRSALLPAALVAATGCDLGRDIDLATADPVAEPSAAPAAALGFAAGTRYAVPQPTLDEHFDWYPRLAPWIDDAASGRITVAEALAGNGAVFAGTASN